MSEVLTMLKKYRVAALSQAFLSYAVTETGQTLYEKFEKGGASVLGITYQKGTGDAL